MLAVVRAGLGQAALFGRDAQVGLLRELVAAVADGRGGEVWVEGEPGIGKSAVLAAGLADVTSLGCQVFWAVADELGQRLPLRVALDCLQVVLGSPDPARREIVDLLHAARGAAALGASADPLPALTERLVALVDRLCGEAPVVLVVDDLHWADTESLVVWRQLSWLVPQLPLLLVAACRLVPQRAEVDALRWASVSAGGVVVGLPALPAESVSALVGDLLGVPAAGPRLRAAVRQAAGNPLYVGEVVEALRREQRIRIDDDAAELDDGSGVPVSLAAAITARLGFVSQRVLEMLRAATLLGATFSVTDLAAVAGHPATELAALVEEALAGGVLVESGPRLAFRHALIRQSLYEGAPVALRFALHRQAARALAEAGAEAEPVAAQLLAALPETDAAGVVDEWAMDWLVGPGRVLAYRVPKVAAELLHRAVQHAAPDDPRRPRLEATLVSVLTVLGRWPEAVELARRVRAGTRDPDRAAELSWTVGWALAILLRYEESCAALDEALQESGAAAAWTVRLRALRLRVGRPLLAAAGGAPEEAAAARELVVDAERVGDRLGIALASLALAEAYLGQGAVSDALAVVDQALAVLGDDAPTVDWRMLLLYDRRAMLDGLDRLPEAGVAVRELVDTAERYAVPHRIAASRCAAAEHHHQLGRWDEALAELETLANSTLPVTPIHQLLLHGLWALIAAHRDEDTAAAAHLDAVAGRPITPGMAADHAQQLVMARAALADRRGQPEQARDILANLLDPARGRGLRSRRLWLPDLARLAMATDDLDTARAAVAAADDDAAAEATPGRTAAAGHCRGLLEDDPAALLAAVAGYRGSGRPFELARALEDAAVALARHDDLAAARAAFTEATDLYTGLHAEWDLLRADSRLRPYGIRRGHRRRRRPGTGWEALTPTELKVAYRVVEGESNAEIAARLFLSLRTVEIHVSHILTKLAARSRVDIARHAAEHPPAAGDGPAAPHASAS